MMDHDTPQATAPLRAGRPTDERKTEAILDAAKTVFFRHGFGAASIEGIAEQAGVSKVTIYNRFGDKAGLLEALVRRQALHMTEIISQANRDAATLETRLANFGCTLMGFLLDEQHFYFDSMLAISKQRHPGATRRFFDAGPGTMRGQLTAILEAAHARGDLSLDDPQRAAEDLLSLWRGFKDIEARFGVSKMTGADEIKEHVCRGVDVFLRAYRSE